MLRCAFRDAVPAQYIPLLICAVFAGALPCAALLILRKKRSRQERPDAHEPHANETDEGSVEIDTPLISRFQLASSLFLILEAAILFLFLWAMKYADWGWGSLLAMGIFLAVVMSGYFWTAGQRVHF